MAIKYTLDECIDFLDRADSTLFTDDFRFAIMDAVVYLKQARPKPALDEPVSHIKYFRGCGEKWTFYYHSPTHTWLNDMKIGDLVELVKSGGLDNDKFGSIFNKNERRLNRHQSYTVKLMLISNGYLTREEAFKEGCA